MKSFQKMGGLSAWICAATYIAAMGLLFTQLSPFASADLEFDAFMAFYMENQALIFLWHLLMYLVNGAFLVTLALALHDRLKERAPALSQVAAVFGLAWAALVFASGFITLNGWEEIARLNASNPAQAAALKQIIDTITLGLDHSDRFLGCLWVLLVSVSALRSGGLPKALNIFGLVISVPGILSTALPAATELGVAFGLGIIIWWIGLGILLPRSAAAGMEKQTAYVPRRAAQ